MEELPDVGTCPYCRKQLEWDRVDDTIAWCVTPGCKYDPSLSEEANRRRWESFAEFDKLTQPSQEDLYRAKRARIAETEAILRRAMAPKVDYRKLWEGLKAELGRRAEGHLVKHGDPEMVNGMLSTRVTWETNGAEREARETLDRMEQAETLARYLRPAGPDEFARVGAQLRGRE